jgi:hypothetical protein
MSERRRVVLIFAAVGAVAAGGGYYFVKVYQPAQAKKAAQDEIVAWEARWQQARDCLMGQKPASSKTSEALAIRELLPDPWRRETCTPLISKLTRGSAPDTGYAAVESAWADLDKAAGKAASAFAIHISAPVSTHDPLPSALDNLDGARAKLRAAAELPPSQGTGSPLPAATALAVADGKDPLTALDIEHADRTLGPTPSAHGFMTYGKTASHAVQVGLIAGAAPRVDRVGQATVRALPDSTWGAAAGSGAVQVGAIDVEGVMPAPAPLALPKAQDIAVAAAGGTLADGVVVYGSADQVVIAHARASAVTGDMPSRIMVAVTGQDGDGRVALVLTDTNREHHARIVKPGGDEPDINLTKVLPVVPKGKRGPALIAPPCLAKDRAWVQLSGGLLMGFGGGRAVAQHSIEQERPGRDPRPIPMMTEDDTYPPAYPMGCTADGAVFRLGDSPTYVVCDDACGTFNIPDAPEPSAVTTIGGKAVAIGLHGGVVGVWRQAGGAPTFYGLPEPMRLVQYHDWPLLALSDGKTIDVLAHGEHGYYVIRVPAP